MELKGTFVPQFRVPLSRINKVVVKRTKRYPLIRLTKVSTSIGETFPESYRRWKPIRVHCNNNSHGIIQQSPAIKNDRGMLPQLSFNRLQPNDLECCALQNRAFGRFVVREAVLDEEYWAAAWLRAEAHCEDYYVRNHENFKRTYVEQEFYTLKQRCAGRDWNLLKYFCILTVKKEEKNVRRSVLNSVVGTLDVSIRQLLRGELYPGEIRRSSAFVAGREGYDALNYAYVANVSVSKCARRQGIASNMLYFAIDVASAAGVKQLYIHVNAKNTPAQDLYRKIGFEMVETAPTTSSEKAKLLMRMEL